jgi:hypothetical protein
MGVNRRRPRGDHLVIHTPQNPKFHWGNCIFVTDAETARCVETFHAAVPEADWVAIGLARMPVASDRWARCGLEPELDASSRPRRCRGRRRGIASHLLGLAAGWAAEQGCRRWVIVTDASNPAGRVYRNAGFEVAAPSVQAYRPPGH